MNTAKPGGFQPPDQPFPPVDGWALPGGFRLSVILHQASRAETQPICQRIPVDQGLLSEPVRATILADQGVAKHRRRILTC